MQVVSGTISYFFPEAALGSISAPFLSQLKMVLYCHIHCMQHKENWHFTVVKYDGLTLEKLILTRHASQLHHPSLPPIFVRVYGSLVCRLSCVGGGKEPGTQRLHMLSSPRISGNFRKICFVTLVPTSPMWKSLPLTILCVDDDKGVIRAINSWLTGIIPASVHFR